MCSAQVKAVRQGELPMANINAQIQRDVLVIDNLSKVPPTRHMC